MQPSDDLSRVAASPRIWRVGGKDYRVPKLRPRDLGEIQSWLKDRIPDPRDEARKRMEGLPEAVQIHIWDQALEAAQSWPPSLDSAQGQRELLTADGQAFFVHLLLKRTIAGFTEENARAIVDEMDTEDLGSLMTLVMPGDPNDPKAMIQAAAG